MSDRSTLETLSSAKQTTVIVEMRHRIIYIHLTDVYLVNQSVIKYRHDRAFRVSMVLNRVYISRMK